MEQQKEKIKAAIKKFVKEAFELPEEERQEKLSLQNLKIPVLVLEGGEELNKEVKSFLQTKKWTVSQEGDTIYLS